MVPAFIIRCKASTVMSIYDMERRTKTYIAGDWDGDKDAIDQLHKWNDNGYWGLHFTDVHSLTSSNDSSLNCSIKRSLRQRMSISKTFVLIVGSNTNTVRSGSCGYCLYSNNEGLFCIRNNVKDNRSYIQYECDLAKASKKDLKVVVLYNFLAVNRSKCPEAVRYLGTHVAMKKHSIDFFGYPTVAWDYQSVKNAIEG